MTVHTRLHLDPSSDRFAIERVQDVEDIIENNKSLQGIQQKSDWGRHIASIPNVIYEKWLNDEWERGNHSIMWNQDEQKAMIKRNLQSNEWRFLRVDK
jgi:hypothetical protein